MIDGVNIVPRRQIVGERGEIMHMPKRIDPHFIEFGKIYFTCAWPGTVKAWRVHRSMTVDKAVVSDSIGRHDPDEIERIDPFTSEIPYDWGLRHG